jgi:phospholipid/cholesterol/gamma-HCH transport system substrate-binding protein
MVTLKKTKFSVGLFLICGIAMLIIGIVWLGMSNYLEKGSLFVAYFDESVQGLDVDSPVKYRGVHIGRVHSIRVAPDDRLIEVVLKIEADIQPELNAQNLIAKLKSVGITGLMFIELEHLDQEAPKPQMSFSFKPQYPVIPTRPSEISKIFQGIEDIFNMFRALDTQAISDQVIAVLQRINKTIDDAQVTQLMGDLRSTVKSMQQLLNTEKVDHLVTSIQATSDSFNRMAVNANNGITDIRTTVSRLDNLIANSGGDMQQMTTDLKAAAQEVKRAMENAATLLEGTDRKVDTLQRQATVTLNRIEQATDSLNRFLDHLANQPSQVIFGAPAADKP